MTMRMYSRIFRKLFWFWSSEDVSQSCLNPDWVKKSFTSVTVYRPVSTEWQIRNLATRKRKYSVPCFTRKFFCLVFKLFVAPQMPQLPVWGLNVRIVYTHAVISLLEKEMATHSSLLAWRIPRTEEPGGLPSMGSRGVRHDWSDLAAAVLSLCQSSCVQT